MGHPFYLVNQLNGVRANALYFPNHGFTKEALNQAGKFIQAIHKGDALGNPYIRLMTSCYQLSEGVYQDDQKAKAFINKQGLTRETQRPLPCYFLMDQNLISELLGYNRPTLIINWKVFPDKPQTFQILVEGKLHEAKELLYLLNNPVNDLAWVNLKIGQAVPHAIYYHEAYTDKHSGDTLYTVSFFATLSPGLPQKHTLALVVDKDRILKEFLVNIDQLDMDIPFEKELRYYL